MSLACFVFGHALALDENATIWRGFQIVRRERVCLRCGERQVWTSPFLPLGESAESWAAPTEGDTP